MRWFKNEEGSTSLTVILAALLVVALLALSLQWFWVKTSSSDIQYLADMGALTAMEALARTTRTIQVLDLLIASLNFFGLILHGVVLVSGIVMLTSSGLGGASLAPFLTKATEFNRKFIELRKKFAASAYEAAEKVAVASPIVAYAYAANYVQDSASLLEENNKTSYQLLIVPFPIKGSLSQSPLIDETSLREEIEGAEAKTTEDGRELADLEAARKAVLYTVYERDVYKTSFQSFEHWTIPDAIENFRTKSADLALELASSQPAVLPIDSNSDSAREKLRESYGDAIQDMELEIKSRINTKLEQGSSDNDEPHVGQMELEGYFSSLLDEHVYVLEHLDGERKAYHRITTCTGLSNAQSPLRLTTIAEFEGDLDHPPCSLCLPFHWEASNAARQTYSSFTAAWNQEAEAINVYRALRQQESAARDDMHVSVASFFERIADEAKNLLRSGRISYEPPGARGLLSVVVSTSNRKLPRYTLPALTNASEVELGKQVAWSAARLIPKKDTETSKNTLLSLSSRLEPESETLGGSLYSLLGGEGALIDALKPLWDLCAKSVASGKSEFGSFFDDLPFGLGGIGGSFVREISSSLGISKPDMRTFKPVLVNTSQVGSAEVSGLEGDFVTTLKESKKWYQTTQSAEIKGASALLESFIDSFGSDFRNKVAAVLPAKLEGGGVRIPFNPFVGTICTTFGNRLRDQGRNWIATLGGS